MLIAFAFPCKPIVLLLSDPAKQNIVGVVVIFTAPPEAPPEAQNAIADFSLKTCAKEIEKLPPLLWPNVNLLTDLFV